MLQQAALLREAHPDDRRDLTKTAGEELAAAKTISSSGRFKVQYY